MFMTSKELTEVIIRVKEANGFDWVLVFQTPVQTVEIYNDVFRAEGDSIVLADILVANDLFRGNVFCYKLFINEKFLCYKTV